MRLLLALRGWPYVNSDEATLGLMAEDILRHGAHPLFAYGDHHIGAIDAYLQAIFFAVLGSTDLIMHIVTTLQVLFFLIIFYLFARETFSKPVAIVTLLILAFCGQQELFYEQRANRHGQDILVFSALLLLLAYYRLRRPTGRLPLDLGIGLVAGLAIWSSLLTLPYVLAAVLTLASAAILGRRRSRNQVTNLWPTVTGPLLLVAGFLVGAAPMLRDALLTRGSSLLEGLQTASAGGSHGLQAIIQQLGGTFLYAVPSMFGSGTICPHCVVWPSSDTFPTLGQILVITAIGLAFTGVIVGCWLAATVGLAHNAWAALRVPSRTITPSASAPAIAPPTSALDVRWWGQAMLALGVGLTLLLFASSHASFVQVSTNDRYLMGIYLVVPFIAAPLWSSVQTLWRALYRVPRESSTVLPVALLGSVILVALLGINLFGEWLTLQQTFSNPQEFGVPAGTRDVELLDFLRAHHAMRFYTTWWVCYRLMFDSQESDYCTVVSDTNPLAPGDNKTPAYPPVVRQAAHPAYLFDLTTTEASPGSVVEIANLIRSHTPRFAGYTSAEIAGYMVFYYAG